MIAVPNLLAKPAIDILAEIKSDTVTDAAEEYGKLKLELKQKFENDRDSYTYAKTAFIKKITRLAREEMQNIYKLV